MEKPIDVLEIVQRWLKENGYDGLVNLDNDSCGCSLDDFEPCSGIQPDCEAAYKHPCKREYCILCECECDRPVDVSSSFVMKTVPR